MRPDFLIFDFDGVLVDSECIANRIEAEYKTELGFPISMQEHIARFTGLGRLHPMVQEELKRLPPSYWEDIEEKVKTAYRAELCPFPGAVQLLEELRIPKCVASNSDPRSLAFKLQLTGLDRFFTGAAFSGEEVPQGKPAPDLFFHAIKRMGWDSNMQGLVIEDSVAGVTAARAAGLRVWGYLGGGHILEGHKDRLMQIGAERTVQNMDELRSLLLG